MITEDYYEEFNPVEHTFLGYVSELYSSKKDDESHAIIIPISFKYEDKWLPPNSYVVKECLNDLGDGVFAHQITRSIPDINKYDFIEFHVMESNKDGGAKYSVNYIQYTVKALPLPYAIKSTNPKLISQITRGFFNPDDCIIQNCYYYNNSKSYIWYETDNEMCIAGPLKIIQIDDSSYKLIPFSGKEIYLTTLSIDACNEYIFSFSNKGFKDHLINESIFDNLEKTKIDAMNQKQLAEWGKTLINNIDAVDIENYKNIFKILESTPLNDPLSKIRQQRLFDNFNWIEELVSNSEKQRNAVLDKYVSDHPELKDEIEEKLISEFSELEKEKNIVIEDIDNARLQLNSIEEQIKNKEKERDSLVKEIENERTNLENSLNSLKTEKEKIENTINACYKKLELFETREKDLSDLKYLEIQNKERESFSDSNIELEDECPIEVALTRNAKILKYPEEIYIGLQKDSVFINCRAMFVPNISWVYAFGSILGNTKIAAIYPEYDWLHYNDYKNAGLEKIWIDATLNPSCTYLLYIDGINISAPESGLRSLLDVISGKAVTLANTGLEYPKNLKIFASVLPTIADEPEEKLGIHMRKAAFEKWGAISEPSNQNILGISTIVHNKLLSFFPANLTAIQSTVDDGKWKLQKEKYFDF